MNRAVARQENINTLRASIGILRDVDDLASGSVVSSPPPGGSEHEARLQTQADLDKAVDAQRAVRLGARAAPMINDRKVRLHEPSRPADLGDSPVDERDEPYCGRRRADR